MPARTRPRLQELLVKITVECYAKANVGVNVTIDSLAAEIEYVIAKDKLLKELCKDFRLDSTDITLNSDGDQPVAIASLLFSVAYVTRKDNFQDII